MKVIDLTHLSKPYKMNFIHYIGTSQQEFIEMIEVYGGAAKLEEDMCFAFMFDTTSDIDLIEDYNEVANLYPTSNRILGNKTWIGHLPESEWEGFAQKYISNIENSSNQIFKWSNVKLDNTAQSKINPIRIHKY